MMKAMVLALGVAAVLAAVVGLSLTLSPGAGGGGGGGEVQAQGASPAAPANVRAVDGVEPGQAVVRWDAVNAAAFYRIGWVNMETFRAVQAEGGRQWLDVFAFLDVVNRGQTFQTIPELAPGVEYAFIVASVGQRFGNAAGWSQWTYLTTAADTASCPTNATTAPEAPGGSGAPTPTPTPRSTATPAPTATPIPTPTITAQTPGQDGAGHWFYPTPTPTAGPTGNVFDPTPTARPTAVAGSGAGGSGAAAPTPTAGPVANVLDPTPTARPAATATPAPTATPTPTPTPTATPAPTPTPTPAPTPTPTRAANSVAGDRAALVALYRSARPFPRAWFQSTNWGSDRPLGEWYGVTTDSSGRVTRLSLTNNFWGGGTIPAELGNLSKLTHLYLSQNQLEGGIPAELGNLSNLTHLYLSLNSFGGRIPAELGKLSNLTHLNLESNILSGTIPAELGNLSKLTHLYLGGNLLSGTIPAELGNLSKLTHLYLSGCHIDWYNTCNQGLTGCVPAGLSDVPNNDWGNLGMWVCRN